MFQPRRTYCREFDEPYTGRLAEFSVSQHDLAQIFRTDIFRWELYLKTHSHDETKHLPMLKIATFMRGTFPCIFFDFGLVLSVNTECANRRHTVVPGEVTYKHLLESAKATSHRRMTICHARTHARTHRSTRVHMNAYIHMHKNTNAVV